MSCLLHFRFFCATDTHITFELYFSNQLPVLSTNWIWITLGDEQKFFAKLLSKSKTDVEAEAVEFPYFFSTYIYI